MVFECLAANNWSKSTRDWPWQDSSSLLLSLISAALLTSWLVEPRSDPTLPVLVEVSIWYHIIALTHFDGSAIFKDTDNI
jgi:hypothetical protein